MSRANQATLDRPVLLVLASTYPRWVGDPEPGFVHELCKRLCDVFRVLVVTPAAPGVLATEVMDGVEIIRYRYAPASWQTLVHHGGIVTNLRRSPIKFFLLPTFLLGQWAVARRLIKREKVDVLHAHWIIPQGLLGAFLKPPMLVTCHGADIFALRGRIFDRLRRWVGRRSAKLSVVSRSMAQALSENLAPKTAVHVLPMGIDIDRFSVDEVPRSDTELLFVGRLVEKKGLRYLLEAMPKVRAAIPGVRLTIAGFGPEREQLESMTKSLALHDSVRFLGAVSQAELPDLYRAAALFVAPFIESRNGDREGLGLVVAEAMACGCPVIVGDVGGVKDLVGEGHGVIVNARSPEELADAVIGLLADAEARTKMASGAITFIQQNYSWDVVAARYKSLLTSLCKEPVP